MITMINVRERMDICTSCDSNSKKDTREIGICAECGCFLILLVYTPCGGCRLGKWEDIKPNIPTKEER
jgi:hypothetical protein